MYRVLVLNLCRLFTAGLDGHENICYIVKYSEDASDNETTISPSCESPMLLNPFNMKQATVQMFSWENLNVTDKFGLFPTIPFLSECRGNLNVLKN